jgi:hypothetical protein
VRLWRQPGPTRSELRERPTPPGRCRAPLGRQARASRPGPGTSTPCSEERRPPSRPQSAVVHERPGVPQTPATTLSVPCDTGSPSSSWSGCPVRGAAVRDVRRCPGVRAGRPQGSTRPGYDADVLAIGGNPLTDPAALDHIRAVWVRGVRVRDQPTSGIDDREQPRPRQPYRVPHTVHGRSEREVPSTAGSATRTVCTTPPRSVSATRTQQHRRIFTRAAERYRAADPRITPVLQHQGTRN